MLPPRPLRQLRPKPAGEPASDDLPPIEDAGEDHPEYAPKHFLPHSAYTSLEYPGTVSHPSAILGLVSQRDIDDCFNAPQAKEKEKEKDSREVLELRYGGLEGSDPPVEGIRTQTQKLLLKITKRRRRVDEDGQPIRGESKDKYRARKGAEEGVFTAEVMGPISQTVRFRNYHYTPNSGSRTSQLMHMLREIDYDGILGWNIGPYEDAYMREMTPPPDAGPSYQPQYHTDLDLQPPPIFSSRQVPMLYNYKHLSASIEEEVIDPITGKLIKRMVNNRKFLTVALKRISHKHAPGEVPQGPPKAVEEKIPELDQDIINRFRELLAERPVWVRAAILAHFTPEQQRIIQNQKIYWAVVVYSIGAGPYWKTVIRYGYDPCFEPGGYRYQRIYFYLNVQRVGRVADALNSDSEEEEDESAQATRGKWLETQQELVAEGKRPPIDPTKCASFDGKTLHSNQPDYLLEDITDPLIRKFIDDPESRTNVCDPQHGWYKAPVMDLIKSLTKVKIMHILEHNEPAPDSICHEVLLEYETVVRQDDSRATDGSMKAKGGKKAKKRAVEDDEAEENELDDLAEEDDGDDRMEVDSA